MRPAAPVPHVCQRYVYHPRLRSRVVAAFVAIAFALGAIAPPFAHTVAGTPAPRAQTPVVAFAATFVWAAAVAGTWATGANWQVGGVPQASPPTATDDVLFGSGTGATQSNCTLANGDTCRNADFTGYSGTLTNPAASTWSVAGSLTFSAGMTYTTGSTTTSVVAFTATTTNGGGGWLITNNGRNIATVTFTGVGGKWVWQDAIAHGNVNNSVTVSNGDVDFGAFTHVMGLFSASGASTRTVRGTGSVALSGTGVIFNVGTTTNLTWSAATIGITSTSTTATQRTIDGGGQTVGPITFTVASTAILLLRRSVAATGAALTCSSLNVSGGTRTARILAGCTLTVATAAGFNVFGTAGNLVTLDSSNAGTAGTLSIASGNIDAQYLSIKDNTATGGASFWAENSTSVSGNTGWTFGARRTITNSFGLGDSRTQATTSARTVTESFGLTDSRAQVVASARTVTDSFGLVDSRAQVLAAARTITDSFGLVDAVSRVVAAARTVTDGIGFADSASRAVAAARVITDAFGLSDSRAQASAAARVITDVLGLADSMTRETATARTVTDSFGLSDSTTRELAVVRTITDPFGILDSTTRAVAFARAVTDAFTLADSRSQAVDAVRTIVDAFALADSLSRELAIARTIVDAFGLADDVSYVLVRPPHLVHGSARPGDRASTARAGARSALLLPRTATRRSGQGPRIGDR